MYSARRHACEYDSINFGTLVPAELYVVWSEVITCGLVEWRCERLYSGIWQVGHTPLFYFVIQLLANNAFTFNSLR